MVMELLAIVSAVVVVLGSAGVSFELVGDVCVDCRESLVV